MAVMVSIFIPTYNASQYIDATIGSIMSQTYSDWELWLVDDVSTDDTPGRLDEWAARDCRIKVIHKEKNEGFVPFSWNRVFPLLQGDWTLYMSHDDLLSVDCIEHLVKMQKQTGADCVIPSCVGFAVNNLYPEESFMDFNKKSDVGRWNNGQRSVINGKEAFRRMLNYDIPGFALWRTDHIRSLGMPTEAFNSDEGMQRIWVVNCNRVGLCPEAKFYYRLNNNSITRGLQPYHFTSLLTQRRILRTIVSKCLFSIDAMKFFVHYLRSEMYLYRQKK